MFILYGIDSSHQFHYTIVGADGFCSVPNTVYRDCNQTNQLCLNLGEISFFKGCFDNLYSFNNTCLKRCPPGTSVNEYVRSCDGCPRGFYLNFISKSCMPCPCVSCAYGVVMVDEKIKYECGQEIEIPRPPISSFRISECLIGKMNIRATGQIQIPMIVEKNSRKLLKIGFLSTYTESVSIGNLGIEDIYLCNHADNSSIASLMDGITAVLIACEESKQIIFVFDSSGNEVCQFETEYDNKKESSKLITTSDSFVLIGINSNNITATFFPIVNDNECIFFKSEPVILLFETIERFSLDAVYLKEIDKIIITWSGFDSTNLVNDILSITMNAYGDLEWIPELLNDDDGNYTSPKVAEIQGLGYVVTWLEFHESYSSIMRQEFYYDGTKISNNLVSDLDFPIQSASFSVISLHEQSYVVGMIVCESEFQLYCSVILSKFTPGQITEENYFHEKERLFPDNTSSFDMLALPDGGLMITWDSLVGYSFLDDKYYYQSGRNVYGIRFNSKLEIISEHKISENPPEIHCVDNCIFQLFISSDSNRSVDCPLANNTICNSFTSLLSNRETKIAKVYFLANLENENHFLLSEEAVSQNEFAFLYKKMNFYTMKILELRPLYCDNPIIWDIPELALNCLAPGSIIKIYFKSQITILAEELVIENLAFDGVENIKWLNSDIIYFINPDNCIFRRVRCCNYPKLARCADENITLESVSMSVPSNPMFKVTKSLKIQDSIFENFLQPRMQCLFQSIGDTIIEITNTTFTSNKFRIGTLAILNSTTSFTAQRINFTLYNPFNWVNLSSAEKNEDEGYFIYGEGFSNLTITDSIFHSINSQSPGCGAENNFYLRNSRTHKSVRATDLVSKFMGLPEQTSSLIKINFIQHITISNNLFENITGMVGSVLYIQNLRESAILDSNTFLLNFATRAFSNVYLVGNNASNVFMIRNNFTGNLGCLDSFGNILIANTQFIQVIQNYFSHNYLPLSNSLATYKINIIELISNHLVMNGGILFELWESKLSNFFHLKLNNLRRLPLKNSFQSTCFYIEETKNLYSSNNVFLDNIPYDDGSQFIATAITITKLPNNTNITITGDTFSQAFTNYAYKDLVTKTTLPQINIVMSKEDITGSVELSNFDYREENLILKSDFYLNIHRHVFFGLLDSLAFEEREILFDVLYSERNRSKITLTVENINFQSIACLNCTTMLFRVERLQNLIISNTTFFNMTGITLVHSLTTKNIFQNFIIRDSVFISITSVIASSNYFIFSNSEYFLIKKVDFSEFKYSNSIISANGKIFIISESRFSNNSINLDYFIRVSTQNSTFNTLTIQETSCFMKSDMYTSLLTIHNSLIEDFNTCKTQFLNIEAKNIYFDNMTIQIKTSEPPILLNSDIFVLSNSHIYINSSLKRPYIIKSTSNYLYITRNQFKNLRSNTPITLFDIQITIFAFFSENVFYEISELANARANPAEINFIGNVVFPSPFDSFLGFDTLYQFKLLISKNIFLKSEFAYTFISGCLISITDQENTLSLSENIFISLENLLAVVNIVAMNKIYKANISSNIFLNNLGTAVFISVSDPFKELPIDMSSTAILEDNYFVKNYAKVTNQNKGYGAAIFINSKDKTNQMTYINRNYFISNQAQLRGGAIYSDWNVPVFNSLNRYANNFAQRENNIYTYPIQLSKVTESTTVKTNTIPLEPILNLAPESHLYDSFPSGIQSNKNLDFILLDHYGQLCYDDIYSILTVNPVSFNASQVSKFTSQISVRAKDGIYSISSPTFYYPVGKSEVVYFNSTAIDESLNYFVKGTFTFRNCGAGEIIKDEENGQTCQECSTGFYIPYLGENMNGPCLQCDQSKMVCLGGADIGLLPSYWMLNQSADLIFQCPIAKACPGNIPPYKKGSLIFKHHCSTGYVGNLCMNCVKGYGKSSASSECVQCSSSPFFYIKIIVGWLFSFSFFVYGIRQAIKESYSKKKKFEKNQSIKVRIFLNYLQTISLMGDIKVSNC